MKQKSYLNASNVFSISNCTPRSDTPVSLLSAIFALSDLQMGKYDTVYYLILENLYGYVSTIL